MSVRLRALMCPEHSLTRIGLPVLTFFSMAWFGWFQYQDAYGQKEARELWPALIGMLLRPSVGSIIVWQVLEHWRRNRAHAAAIEALNDISAAIADAPEQSQRTLERVTRLAADLLEMPIGVLNLLDPDSDRVTIAFRFGVDTKLPTEYQLQDLPATQESVRTGKLLFVGNVDRDYGRFDKSALRANGILSLVVIPLMVQDKAIGTISLFDRRVRKLGGAQLRVASMWAAQAAVIIRNAELFKARAALAAENAELLEQTRRDAEAKAILLRELNHRVKNNLAGIAGLLSTSPAILPEESRRWLDRVVDRIDAMTRIHELFVNGTTAITLAELIRKTIEPIQAAKPAGVNIELDLDGDSVKLADDRAVTLAMVLHELCFNAIRHGVREHGTIIIQSRISERHGLIIHVIDDGGGAVSHIDETSKSGGIGLSLIRGLVGRELHGEFRIEPRPGSGTIATIEVNGARGSGL